MPFPSLRPCTSRIVIPGILIYLALFLSLSNTLSSRKRFSESPFATTRPVLHPRHVPHHDHQCLHLQHSHRLLFADDYCIDILTPGITIRQGTPRRENRILSLDTSLDGMYSNYFTILHDPHAGRGPAFVRMYYRCIQAGISATSSTEEMNNNMFTCYAESTDYGLTFTRVNTHLFEFDGTTNNNIVWKGPLSHNLAVFLDPHAIAGSRYKALAGADGCCAYKGAFLLHSPDGIRWSKLSPHPFLTRENAANRNFHSFFDSLNSLHYNHVSDTYDLWARVNIHHGLRSVASRRIANLTHPDIGKLDGDDLPLVEVSDAQQGTETYYMIHPVHVAHVATPRIAIGTRFVLRTRRALKRPGEDTLDGTTDIAMLVNRMGAWSRVTTTAFVSPSDHEEEWVGRALYNANGVVEHPRNARTSLYALERTNRPGAHLRRFSIRTDGFTYLRFPDDNSLHRVHLRPFQVSCPFYILLNALVDPMAHMRISLVFQDLDKVLHSLPLVGDHFRTHVSWNSSSDMVIRLPKSTSATLVVQVHGGANLYSLRAVCA